MSDKPHSLARRPTKPVAGKPQSPPSGTISKNIEINVILDEEIETDDIWEVEGGDKKTLVKKDAEPLVKGHKILRFKIKPTKKTYSLSHHRSGANKRPVFLGRPYPLGIEKDKKSQTAPHAYAQLVSQVPKKLPGQWATSNVDADLVQDSPILVDLKVTDPEL
ncbi:MAG TPA: hypothetical protein VNT79_18270 [Phycisphaerae bacterium]|nr:hypothetical protein [Phycisphaerae bacterium]